MQTRISKIKTLPTFCITLDGLKEISNKIEPLFDTGAEVRHSITIREGEKSFSFADVEDLKNNFLGKNRLTDFHLEWSDIMGQKSITLTSHNPRLFSFGRPCIETWASDVAWFGSVHAIAEDILKPFRSRLLQVYQGVIFCLLLITIYTTQIWVAKKIDMLSGAETSFLLLLFISFLTVAIYDFFKPYFTSSIIKAKEENFLKRNYKEIGLVFAFFTLIIVFLTYFK